MDKLSKDFHLRSSQSEKVNYSQATRRQLMERLSAWADGNYVEQTESNAIFQLSNYANGIKNETEQEFIAKLHETISHHTKNDILSLPNSFNSYQRMIIHEVRI